MTFNIPDDKYKIISDWMKSQRKDERYEGAIGGRFSFNFTFTTLGCAIVVTDNMTKETLDVTDYENW